MDKEELKKKIKEAQHYILVAMQKVEDIPDYEIESIAQVLVNAEMDLRNIKRNLDKLL